MPRWKRQARSRKNAMPRVSSRARLLAEPASPIERDYLSRWLASLDRAGGARLPVFRSRRRRAPVVSHRIQNVGGLEAAGRISHVDGAGAAAQGGGSHRRMKVLYFCEGYTDIRFVVGLSEICDLTMAIPSEASARKWSRGPARRERARVHVDDDRRRPPRVPVALGAVSASASFASFDVVLSQEMGRGSLNATAVGRRLGVPVVLYLGTSPVEYFHCRRIRGQVGPIRAWASETFLATAMKSDRSAFVGRRDDRTVSWSNGGAACLACLRGLLLRHRHQPVQARLSGAARVPSRAPAVPGRQVRDSVSRAASVMKRIPKPF